MESIRNNRLLLQVLIVYTLYILVGWSLQRPLASSATGILSLMVGVVFAMRYTVPAYRILFLRERGEYGAHNSILGACEISYGMIYSGLFRLFWIYFERPETWSSTVWSSLGLFMIAKGAFRLAISPSQEVELPNFPANFLYVIMWIFGLILAFVAGNNLQ